MITITRGKTRLEVRQQLTTHVENIGQGKSREYSRKNDREIHWVDKDEEKLVWDPRR